MSINIWLAAISGWLIMTLKKSGMKNKNLTYAMLLFFGSVITMSCHEGVGCPADQYNDWKKIEANRKQQLKSPNNPGKTNGKKGKANVQGNGVVPQ